MAFLMTFTQCVHLVVWMSLVSCAVSATTTTTPTTRTRATSTTIATTTTTTSTPTTPTKESQAADVDSATTTTSTTSTSATSARSMTTATTSVTTSSSTTISQGLHRNGSQQFQPFSFGVGFGTGVVAIIILATVCIAIVFLKKKWRRNEGTQKNDKCDEVWYEDVEAPEHSHSVRPATEVADYEMVGNMYESLHKGRRHSNSYGELQTSNKGGTRKIDTPADSSGKGEIQGTFYETLQERSCDSQTRSGEIHTAADERIKVPKAGCEYEMLTPPSKSQTETGKGTDSQTGDDILKEYKTDTGTDAPCGVADLLPEEKSDDAPSSESVNIEHGYPPKETSVTQDEEQSSEIDSDGDTYTEEKGGDAFSAESGNAEHGYPSMETSVTEDEDLSSEIDNEELEALREVYSRIQRESVDSQTRTSLSGLPV